MSGFSGNYLDALAHPVVPNPIAAIAAGNQAAETTWKLRDIQAQNAWGNALAQSVGPDGTVDYNKARALAAQNPMAQMGMMAGLKGASELGGQQQKQGIEANRSIGDAITGAMQADDGNLHQAVATGMQRLIDSGVINRDRGMLILSRLPNDPTALRQTLEQTRLSLAPPEMQQAGVWHTPGTTTDAQGRLIGTQQAPVSRGSGVSAPGEQPGAPQGAPGRDLDTPSIKTEGPRGEPILITPRQWFRLHPEHAPPGFNPDLPPSLRNPAKVPPAGGGTPTPGQPAPGQPAPGQPAPGQPAPGAGVVVGPAPADLEQQKADAANNARAFQDISDKAVASRDRSAILGNMLGDTTQFTTGTLAGITDKLRKFGIALKVPGVDVQGQTAQESFTKLAAQLANAQGAGAPSDARQAMNVAANPHAELSPAGVDLMIRQLQGNEDYLQARAKLAGSSDQRDIKRFENETGIRLDPRAFQFARMQPAQRNEYIKGLSPTDRDKVRASYNWAHDQKLVSGP